MADFQVYWWRKKSKLKPWMLTLLLVVFVSFSNVHLLRRQPLMFLCLAGIPFVLIFAFAVWFVPFAAKMRAKLVPGFLDKRSLRIDTSAITEKTSVSETILDWKKIQGVEEGGKCLYFFLNAQYALLLPKRTLSSPDEARAFLNTARRYWEAAKAGKEISADDAEVWPPPPRIGA